MTGPIDTIRESLFASVSDSRDYSDALAALTEVEHQLAAAYDREYGTSDALDTERARAEAAETALAEINEAFATLEVRLQDMTAVLLHAQAERVAAKDRGDALADALRAIVQSFEKTDYCEARDLANIARAALDRQEHP